MYKKNNPNADMDAIFSNINKSFDNKLADKKNTTVMNKHFTDENGNLNFDFENYDHRVKLGQELIKLLYEEDKKQ